MLDLAQIYLTRVPCSLRDNSKRTARRTENKREVVVFFPKLLKRRNEHSASNKEERAFERKTLSTINVLHWSLQHQGESVRPRCCTGDAFCCASSLSLLDNEDEATSRYSMKRTQGPGYGCICGYWVNRANALHRWWTVSARATLHAYKHGSSIYRSVSVTCWTSARGYVDGNPRGNA